MARQGRRAVDMSVDTRPGQVMLLGFLANVPIAVGFVLAPLLTRGDTEGARAFVPFVLFGTLPMAAWSLFVYFRMPRVKRAHRAARIGFVLSAVALGLWVLVLALSIRG